MLYITYFIFCVIYDIFKFVLLKTYFTLCVIYIIEYKLGFVVLYKTFNIIRVPIKSL